MDYKDVLESKIKKNIKYLLSDNDFENQNIYLA